MTKHTILMMKQANPDWGCQRISDMLVRGPAPPPSPACCTRPATNWKKSTPGRIQTRCASFERAKPNQLWQTALFTFVLKRQNRRVYLVAFMDDHSRFLVSYGLHASQSTALVLEVLRAGLTNYGAPAKIPTDNGTQYVTWRGKSAFTRELEKRGIQQVVAAPHRPQTLGKIERFWGTLWRECIERAFSSTSAMPSGASATSSTITTSSGLIRGSTVWCRPIASSAPPRKCSRPSRRGWRPMPWPWPGRANPKNPST